MVACHAVDPGSSPGQCNLPFFFSNKNKQNNLFLSATQHQTSLRPHRKHQTPASSTNSHKLKSAQTISSLSPHQNKFGFVVTFVLCFCFCLCFVVVNQMFCASAPLCGCSAPPRHQAAPKVHSQTQKHARPPSAQPCA